MLTEFAWLADDQRQRSEDEYSEDDDTDAAALVGHTPGGFGMPRNVPCKGPRPRAATDEGLYQLYPLVGNLKGTYSTRRSNNYPATLGAKPTVLGHQSSFGTKGGRILVGSSSRDPPRHTQTGSSQLPLALVAGVGPMLSQSPRPNASYFSPVTEKQMASHTPSGQFPFPQQPSPDHNNISRYSNTPVMARSTSREGATIQAAQDQFAHHQLQKPLLPGVTPPNSALQQWSRMRSASSPNIHHVPSQAQLARSMIPPMPPVPPSYVAYSGGPAVINRSRNNSLACFKLRVKYENDEFVIIVPYNSTYAHLMDQIVRKVTLRAPGPGVPPPPNIRIRYLDKDSNHIYIGSDDDLRMAFDTSSAPGQNDSAGLKGVVSLFVSV